MEITSPQNPRVKDAARLRERRGRDKQRRIAIDGGRETLRALEGGLHLHEVFVCESLVHTDDARRAVELVEQRRVEILSVTPEIFSKLAYGDRADGVLAVAETPQPTLDDWQLADPPLVAVLEGLEKPGNLGAVLRSADAAGVSGVIVANPRTDLYNSNVIRASLGTVFTLPVAAVTSDEALRWLRARAMQIFATRVDGSIPYTQAKLAGPTAIVLGSEADGLSAAWTAADITPIALPMRGAADSLNVSATAAVLFYEALRQRLLS